MDFVGKVFIQSPQIRRVCHLTIVDRNLEQAQQKFWELEAVEKFMANENICEELCVTEFRSIAKRRFLNIEKRLERDPITKKAYCRFMAEYEAQNQIVKLVDPIDDSSSRIALLPSTPSGVQRIQRRSRPSSSRL